MRHLKSFLVQGGEYLKKVFSKTSNPSWERGGEFKLRFDQYIGLSCLVLPEGILGHALPLNLESQKRFQRSRLGVIYNFGEK